MSTNLYGAVPGLIVGWVVTGIIGLIWQGSIGRWVLVCIVIDTGMVTLGVLIARWIRRRS